ncbi:MAG TPA: AAA family ATPase [Candidatus Dormibacteraeota bacterium]
MAQIWEREATLETIGRLLADARQGQGKSLFIVGEAGLGKTTMVEHALAAASTQFQIGVGRGDAAESTLPFGILDQALRRLGLRASPESKTRRSTVQARAARQYATLQFLESVKQPTLLLLDDLHWADDDSLAMLSFLCRRIGSLPVAVMGTMRPWPRAALGMAVRLTKDGDAVLERLRPLSESGAAAMLKTLSDGAISPSSARRAAALAAGNPLLIEQVAGTLRRGRALPESTDSIATNESRLVGTWFAGESAQQVRYAQAASVLGIRFRPAIAAPLADLTEREGDQVLEALLEAGVFKSDTAGWARFAHPLLHQVIYGEIPPALLARWHASAFRLLRAAGADLSESAEHAARAGMLGDQDAVAVLTHAGRAAMLAGAIARARQRLDSAVQTAGSAAAPDLLMDLGQVQLEGGEGRQATTTFRRLLALADLTPHQRFAAQRMLGRALFISGSVGEANEAFHQAVAAATPDDPSDAVRALLDQAFIAWPTKGPAVATPLLAQARALAREVSPTLRSRVDTAWAFSTFVSADPSGIPVIQSRVEDALANPEADTTDFSWSWGTLGTYGNMAKWIERFDEATHAYEVGMRAAERMGLPVAIAAVAVMHADTCLRTGDLRLAYQLADRATLDANLAPERAFWAALIHCYIANEQGQMEECAAWWRRSSALADPNEEWAGRVWLLHMEAVLAMHARETARACALFDRLRTLATRLQILEPCIVPWAGDAITAYAYGGRFDEALGIMASLEEMGERLPCRFPQIVVRGARAAFMGKDTAGAAQLLEEAIDLARRSGMPLVEARMQHRLGALLRKAGKEQDARPYLREAQLAAASRGADGLAAKAAAELKAAGGRQHQPAVDPDALTPAEDRVCALAERGVRPQQIAAQLFKSINTIETQLQSIYRKRQVNSQTELMAKARQREPVLAGSVSGPPPGR